MTTHGPSVAKDRGSGWGPVHQRHLLQKAANMQEVDWLRAGRRPQRAVAWGSAKSGCGTSCKKRQNCKRLNGYAQVGGHRGPWRGVRRSRAASSLAYGGNRDIRCLPTRRSADLEGRGVGFGEVGLRHLLQKRPK